MGFGYAFLILWIWYVLPRFSFAYKLNFAVGYIPVSIFLIRISHCLSPPFKYHEGNLYVSVLHLIYWNQTQIEAFRHIYWLFPLHNHRCMDRWKQRNYVLWFSLALFFPPSLILGIKIAPYFCKMLFCVCFYIVTF